LKFHLFANFPAKNILKYVALHQWSRYWRSTCFSYDTSSNSKTAYQTLPQVKYHLRFILPQLWN